MMVSMTGYPAVEINEAGFEFSPAFAELKNADTKCRGEQRFQSDRKT